RGFDNETIGLVFSFTGIFTIVFQTITAKFLDHFKRIKIQTVIITILFIMIFVSILIIFLRQHVAIFLLIILNLSLVQNLMGLVNSLAFIYEPVGIEVNYGFSRGMGSFSYAVTTMVIGSVIEKTSSNILPMFYIIFSISLIGTIILYR